MILKKFRVKDFRSIVDTGWIDCQTLTAFAGENESGKTTLLMALLKLMPVRSASSYSTLKGNGGKWARINLKSDVPIDRAEELMPVINDVTFIQAVFELPAATRALISETYGGWNPGGIVTISKTYGGGYSVAEAASLDADAREKVTAFLTGKIPEFMYFQEMTQVNSKIDLVSLAYKLSGLKKNQKLTERESVFSNLLNYLDIWESNLIKSIAEKYDELSKCSEAEIDFRVIFDAIPLFYQRFKRGFSELNAQFAKWWGDENITIGFEPYKRGILIKVTDKDGDSYLLENRSTGFRRFFGLFLSFSVTARRDYENAILLFDEAGAALHPLTQRKLAVFFQELGKHTQIFYNTHTSYMLPVAEMNRVRVVFKDNSGHTCIGKQLTLNAQRTNEMSLFPVYSSLVFHISEKSLAGCLPIITLNEEDRCYLTLIKNVLSATQKFNTIYETLVFSTGPNGIDACAELLSEGGSLSTVILPSDAAGKAVKKRLTDGLYSKVPHKVLELSDLFPGAVTSEDIIPAEFIELFSRMYLAELLGKGFVYDRRRGLIEQIEAYAREKRIALPGNYRAEIAKRMKLSTMRNFASFRVKIKNTYFRNWTRMWERLVEL